MKINFNIKDRIRISDLLPKKSDTLTLLVVKGIVDKVQLSIDEINSLEMKAIESDAGISYRWDQAKEANMGDKEFDLSEAEIEVIKKTHKALDEKKAIEFQDLSLWMKLLEGGK